MKSRWHQYRNSIGWLYILLLLNIITSCTQKKTPKMYIVEIKQMQFQPADLTVQDGDTVAWINHDMVPHDITEEKSKSWTSGPLLPNKSWSMPVTKSADYYCSIHVVMKGRITVQ